MCAGNYRQRNKRLPKLYAEYKNILCRLPFCCSFLAIIRISSGASTAAACDLAFGAQQWRGSK